MTYICQDHDGKYGECFFKKPCTFIRQTENDGSIMQCPMRHLKNHGKRLYPEYMPVRLG